MGGGGWLSYHRNENHGRVKTQPFQTCPTCQTPKKRNLWQKPMTVQADLKNRKNHGRARDIMFALTDL